MAEGDSPLIELERLPMPAIASRDGVLVAVNHAYRELLGYADPEIVGKPVTELINQLISPADRLLLQRAVQERAKVRAGQGPDAPRSEAQFWCTVIDKGGRRRAMRVEWRVGPDPRESVTFLMDAEPEAYGQQVTQLLARSAGGLSRCATEQEVLEKACDAVAAQGFIVTALLIVPGAPTLEYGPTRMPPGMKDPGRREWESAPPPRELLERLNPRFSERAAAFFQDGVRLIRDAYPEPIAEVMAQRLPAQRMVQAPLFLGDEPYGALAVTGDLLTPLVATALELFAELVGHALCNVRLRRERVERERLAALGEAAAVMAHEVRNPVGAISNALAVLRRGEAEPHLRSQLLSVISEEAGRLEQLVTQLLDLGRPMMPRPRKVELGPLARASINLLEARGECRRGWVELAATGTCAAELDPDLAQLALLNVLRNACQSCPATGRIRVSLERDERGCAFVVEDEGPGLPQEVITRLGEPFTTTRATGTGMGLAVVRRVLEASHGRLEVRPSSLGGTGVWLWFPARA